MAKPPTWMKMTRLPDGNIAVHINRLHPLFWLEVIKAKVLGLWCDLRHGKCDYECGYCYPYGFVPEAGCPVHD